MPYKDPDDRDYKKDYAAQKKRGKAEHERRMERQRARRELDKKGIDREGKDVSHKKALSKGGSNSDGVTLEAPSKNRRRNYAATRKPPRK